MDDGYAPTSLSDALRLLAGEELVPYAGGTDLLVSEARSRPFLFLHRVLELKRFDAGEQGYFIGAGLTYTELLDDERTPAILRRAIATIAAPALRNLATIGGNIANASPKGDAALVLMAADAVVHLVSAREERQIPLREFCVGRGRTLRRPDELLVGFTMPRQWLKGGRFEKVGERAALALSRVSFAGLYAEDAGRVTHLATAFGAVEDTIVRRCDLDAQLIGATVPEARELAANYVSGYSAALKPICGRVSAAYRKQVCINLLCDFLVEKLGGFPGGPVA
jgi:CO/xanthine dehydrogenase FAD-binding subunit